jgi:hypothetical protein
MQTFFVKPYGKNHFEILGVEGRIIVKWNLSYYGKNELT